VPRSVIATSSAAVETPSLSREWRLRAAAGELRRGGLAVVLERAIPAPEESRCLFAVVAASKRVVERAAEVAQLGPAGIAEPRGRRAYVA
jgi:hypothetical protein